MFFSPSTRLLFPQSDDRLLEPQLEDGQLVEPEWLCPVVPLILINGTEGIGTGWSTKVANRRVEDVIDTVRRAIDKDADKSTDKDSLILYYQDFRGKIDRITENQFSSTGIAHWCRQERKNSAQVTLEILELPVGIWTTKYKEKLMKILEKLPVVHFSEHHTERRVHFRIALDRKKMKNSGQLRNQSDLIGFLKLKTFVTENLVLFDANGRLREFQNVRDIASEFFETRKTFYEKRLETQRRESQQKLDYVGNQV